MHTSQHVSGRTRHRETVLWGAPPWRPVLPPRSWVPRVAGVLHTLEHTQTRGCSGSLFRTGFVHICAVVGSLARPPAVQWRKKSADSHGGGATCGLPPASCLSLCAWAHMPGPTCRAAPSPPTPCLGWSGGGSKGAGPVPETTRRPLSRSVCWSPLRQQHLPLVRWHVDF